MIKPKHSFFKQKYNVNEEFIDRIEAKNLFYQKLMKNKKAYNVLVFYGVGGIGKSKLRKEICRIHSYENKESVIFYLDFNNADDRNLGSGILKLVDSCNTKIDFKCFELAYALYFRKKNPSALYGREKNMVTQNPFVGIGLNIIGIFDNGLVGTAAEIVERTIRAISNRVIDKEVKEELKRFDDYSIQEMEERLPLFFQYDLATYLSKHNETKILIVFDTFEALNENVIEQVHRRRNERWVQEIIEYFDSESFPNLLVSIFGRDKLEWGEEWDAILDQYLLSEFDDCYSKEYLRQVGVEETEIIDFIAKGSKGFPLLLYLSAETYVNIRNANRTPIVSDFGANYPEIIERFLYNLDKDTVEVLRLMSVPNYYDTEIFDFLIKSFNVSFPMTEYEQFNKYSFVNYDHKEAKYFIHSVIRSSILNKTSDSVILSAQRKMLQFFSNKIDINTNTFVVQLFYHARKSKDVKDYNQWLYMPLEKIGITPIQMLQRMQIRGEQIILIQIIDGILSEYDINCLNIELINIYIDVVHLGGDYDIAVKMCDKYLQSYSSQAIIETQQLLKMRIRKIHHSMFFAPVDGLIKEAVNMVNAINDVDNSIYEYFELLFLIGGNLGVLSGDFEYAWKWLEKSQKFAEDHNLVSFLHRTIRKQVDILIYKNDFDTALRLLQDVVSTSLTIDEIDTRYKIYLMASLGELYRKQGNMESAWFCYHMVDKKCTENYMPGWQAHSYLAKGMIKMQTNEFRESLDYFENLCKYIIE